MKKKGLSHVDWIMSFGIFILLVVTLFVLFGPSLSQEYEDKYLLEIAQKGLKNASFDQVFVYPIFIKTSNPVTTPKKYSVNLPAELLSTNLEKISLSYGLDNILVRKMISGNNLVFDLDISPFLEGGLLTGNGGCADYNDDGKVAGQDLQMFMECMESSSGCTEYMDFNDDGVINMIDYDCFHGYMGTQTITCPDDAEYCSDSSIDITQLYLIYSNSFHLTPVNPTEDFDANYEITTGAKSKSFVFSENKFLDLASLDYNEFKETLKYPKSKNIAVFIYRHNESNLMYSYNKSQPSEKDQVYVMRWFDNQINESGRAQQVIINLRVW